ncbi:ABC-2 type transport system ATP-binding protein [Enterococcus sp. DIV0212c]|uniref:ABC transporter ATP-binding protein n=1 Tax=Enterococcus sp. DIV0212c TaxID=2230867 RepID=UPI001A9B2DFD|nr:ABC transporter ATP-binding protein [Enterococcus sp. DIV0212c]MBO1354657.1 ABC transporter ATP-binding protein [Enterococcus sp. DIV0212c]
MKSIINIKNLKVVYGNKKVAVNEVTFDVNEGEIFGILGPNGAGKTSLIKSMATMLLPTEGSIHTFGIDSEKFSKEIRSKINFVYGGEQGFYPRLTSKEYLSYFCSLYGKSSKESSDLIKKILTEVRLEQSQDLEIYKYSKGMKQRLHLARSLINNPRILFLDEPTVGLDPEGVSSLRKLIGEISHSGITIILCTHDIMEAQELCDRIAFFSDGKISSIDTPKKMIQNMSDKIIKFQLLCNKNRLENLNNGFLSNHAHKIIKNSGYEILVYYSKVNSYHKIRNFVTKQNLGLINQEKIDLEDAYLYYYKELEVYDHEKNYE